MGEKKEKPKTPEDILKLEIAEELGFCDASHLAVFFRSRAGCTPGQYRNPIKHQE